MRSLPVPIRSRYLVGTKSKKSNELYGCSVLRTWRRSRTVRFGAQMSTALGNWLLAGFLARFKKAHVMIIAITAVLPEPVAILQPSRRSDRSSGLAVGSIKRAQFVSFAAAKSGLAPESSVDKRA